VAPARRSRGFSLIETMIVVCLVGVLAVLATLAYRRWIKASYLAEAQDVVSSIRAGENAIFAENGAFLNVTAGLGTGQSYPSPNPGAFKTAWGGPCGTCANPNAWDALGVHVGGPVAFGYSAIAGDGVKVQPSLIGTPKVNGVALNYTGMLNSQPWFFVQADGDISGTSSFQHVSMECRARTRSTWTKRGTDRAGASEERDSGQGDYRAE
jgi:prepilin-type N-terminal cleavage/methylation domain-containing protein